MHMYVVRHVETAEQIDHRRMMTDKVVQFDDARALTPEQAQQLRQFVRHDVAQVGEGIRGAVADRDASCAIRRAGRSQYDGAVAVAAVPLHRGRDLALHATVG